MAREPTEDAVPGLDMGRFSALLKAETERFHRNRPKSAALLDRARKFIPMVCRWLGWSGFMTICHPSSPVVWGLD